MMKITEEYYEYLKDESRLIGQADSISFPENEDDVKRIMIENYKSSVPVTIQGARTGISAGAVPYGGHIINMSKMNKVKEMTFKDGHYFLQVEPGLILSKLREAISKRQFDTSHFSESSLETYHMMCKDEEQFFPPDPTEASATIGGMVACNASGARSFMYGSTRNYISRLRVVLSNGDCLDIKRGETFSKDGFVSAMTEGGKKLEFTVPDYQMPDLKNTSGYFVKKDMDLIDLFIGSDGTLGVVTSIEIQLLALPKCIWGTTLFFRNRSRSIAFVSDVRQQVKAISSIEYFDFNALNILRDQMKVSASFSRIPEFPTAQAAIYLEFHCDSDEQAYEKLLHVEEIMLSHGGDSRETWVARNDHDRNLLYFFRHAIPESVNMLIDGFRKEDPSITKLGTDMSVPDDKLEEMMDIYYLMLEKSDLLYATWGHIGDNHLHVNMLPRNQEDYEVGKALYKKWAGIVVSFNGAVSAEHGIGKLKKDYLKMMYDDLSGMIDIKNKLDDKNLLGLGTLFDIQEVV